MAIGGLFRLQPVMYGYIFKYIDNNEQGILAPNVWQELFKMFELKQIMRQRESKQFVEMLKRLGESNHTNEDIVEFKKGLFYQVALTILEMHQTKMTDSSLQNVGNGMASNNGKSAIIMAISSMSELLVSSITSRKSTMAESLGQIKETIDQLVIEEGPSGENDEQLQIAAIPDEPSTEQSNKNQQSGSAESNNGAKKPTTGESTEQSINTLINQGSVLQQDACGKIELLSGTVNDLKLDQKKAPAVKEQIAKIVQGLLREKLTEKVLTATQNCYNMPENCE